MSAQLAPYALDPFGPSANPGAYVAYEASERARGALEGAMDRGRIAVLLGPPGHGKTLLLRLLAGREQERARVAYVPFCNLDVDEFFALVLTALGVTPDGMPRETVLATARRLASRGGIAIFVDDASAMSEECAAALASLYDAAQGTLRIALATVDGVDARRVLASFEGRTEIVHLADGMTAREARHYVESRLAYGGARPELVAAFDERTIQALHRASQGVPRRLNHVAQDVVRRSEAGAAPSLRALAGLEPAPPARGPAAALAMPPTHAARVPPSLRVLEAAGRSAAPERPAQWVAEPPVERVAERPVERVVELPVERVSEPPVERVSERPAQRVAEPPVERVSERPAERVAEPPVERVSERPAKTLAERTPERVTEQTPEPPPERPSESSLLAETPRPPARGAESPAPPPAARPARIPRSKLLRQPSPATAPHATAPPPAREEPAEGVLLPGALRQIRDGTGEYRVVRGRSASAQPPPPRDEARGPEPLRAGPERDAARQPAPVAKPPQTARELALAKASAREAEMRARAVRASELPEPSYRFPSRWIGALGFVLGIGIALYWLWEREAPPAWVETEAPTATLEPPQATESAPEAAAKEFPAPEPSPPAPDLAADSAPAPTGLTPSPPPLPDPGQVSPTVAVSINATPWAVIEVDGRPLGETPMAGIELAPGPHTFRATLPDGTMREEVIEISSEHTTIVFE